MSEPTWWEDASPAWLFRAKPADYMDCGGICPGLLFVPGLMALLLVHILFLGFPLAVLLQVGWYPEILWLTLPVLLLWVILIPADVKFRLQKATLWDVWQFDRHFIYWFGFVFWPVVLASAVIAGVVAVVWWVVSLLGG